MSDAAVLTKQMNEIYQNATLVYPPEQILAAITAMGAALTEQLGDQNPIFLCVMNGGLVFTGHLMMQCPFPLQQDYIHVSRYRGETSGGQLNCLVKPRCSLQDRVVVILDDILDEGLTLQAIIEECYAMGAQQVYTAVLIDKQRPRPPEAVQTADFTGLEVEDNYVFGFGMDYKEYWRNAPGLYQIDPRDA